MKDVWFQRLHFRDHAENAHQLERTKSSSQQSAHVLHQVRGVLTFSSDWHRHSACASVCPALRSGVVRQTRVSMSSSQLDLGAGRRGSGYAWLSHTGWSPVACLALPLSWRYHSTRLGAQSWRRVRSSSTSVLRATLWWAPTRTGTWTSWSRWRSWFCREREG